MEENVKFSIQREEYEERIEKEEENMKEIKRKEYLLKR